MHSALRVILLALLLWRSAPSCGAAPQSGGAEIFHPDVEAASLEKAVTNLARALDQQAKPVATHAYGSVSMAAGIIVMLAGLIAFRRLAPRLGDVLSARPGLSAAGPSVEELAAERESFAKFAETFAARQLSPAVPVSSEPPAISPIPDSPENTVFVTRTEAVHIEA